MIKAEFSASFLQSSVSHDPSEIILICWFAAQVTWLLVSMLKTVVLLYMLVFVESSKVQHLFKIVIFCYVTNVKTQNCHFSINLMHPAKYMYWQYCISRSLNICLLQQRMKNIPDVLDAYNSHWSQRSSSIFHQIHHLYLGAWKYFRISYTTPSSSEYSQYPHWLLVHADLSSTTLGQLWVSEHL